MFFRNKEPLEITPVVLSLKEAEERVVQHLVESSNTDWVAMFEAAKSGVSGAYEECLKIIQQVLSEQLITIHDYDNSVAAVNIFHDCYGLGALTSFYQDPEIDEIRVTPQGTVYVVLKGRLETTDIKFSNAEVGNMINRLKPASDMGVSLDESNPTMELVRPDGSRLTAICRPVTERYCFALRKPGNLNVKDFIKLKTFDERVARMLAIFTKGRRNILVCGGVNSGKTTLLRLLASQLDPQLSIRVLDTDNELKLARIHPDREIWELEAHPEVGADMEMLFTKILRITPDVIIVPEFRGKGEVWTTIEACTRGHDGSMATAHFSSFSSPEEAVRNTAMLALKEKAHLPLDLVIERVAQAFQIIIQTFNDARTGIKKITSITEVVIENGKTRYNPLVTWEAYSDNYTGDGEWKVLNPLSERCINNMKVYGVSLQEIHEAWEGI